MEKVTFENILEASLNTGLNMRLTSDQNRQTNELPNYVLSFNCSIPIYSKHLIEKQHCEIFKTKQEIANALLYIANTTSRHEGT